MRKLLILAAALLFATPALAQTPSQSRASGRLGQAVCVITTSGVARTSDVASEGVVVCNPDGSVIGGASSAAASGVLPNATTAAVSGQVAKASAGNLYGFTGHSSATGWFLVFDAIACPADGAVAPKEFIRYPTVDVTVSYAASPPVTFLTGISICFSTTGPYTKTASATASISSKVK